MAFWRFPSARRNAIRLRMRIGTGMRVYAGEKNYLSDQRMLLPRIARHDTVMEAENVWLTKWQRPQQTIATILLVNLQNKK